MREATVYCTIPALAGYSSYSVRIPSTRMKASFHICGTTLHARQHSPSHLLPTTSLLPSKPSEPSYLQMHHRIISMRTVIYHARHDLGQVLRLLLLQRQGSRSREGRQ